MAGQVVEIPDEISKTHPRCFALKVNGPCMEPDIPHGSIIVVDPNVQPVGDGNEPAVIEVDGTFYLCRPLTVCDQVVMVHDNPVHLNAMLPTDRVHVAGKVVWVNRVSEG